MSKENLKYKSLDEVAEAYQKGELDGEDSLMIDNDTCFIYKNGVKVFDADPEDLLEESLFLLGIPCDHV